MNVKILLVDDHPLLRSALRQVMAHQADIVIVGDTATGAAALQLAQELSPDLVFLDVHLPDLDGIEVSRRLRKLLPRVKIIIYSGDLSRPLVDAALEAGVSGYVSKSNSPQEVLQALTSVLSGHLFLSPEASASILEDYCQKLANHVEPAKISISERDKELIRMVAEGRRNKEIADQLKLKPKSVETYRARLMKKLGCASSAELVRYAIREGIASP